MTLTKSDIQEMLVASEKRSFNHILDALDQVVLPRFDTLEKKVDNLDERLGNLEVRVSNLEETSDELSQKMSNVGKKLDVVIDEFGDRDKKTNKRLTMVETMVRLPN